MHSFDMDHFYLICVHLFLTSTIEEESSDSVNAYRHKCADTDIHKKITDVWSNSKQ